MIPLMGLTDKWLALAGRDGASEQELAQAERELGVQFPDDYRAVMLRCDGGGAGEGYAGTGAGNVTRDAWCFRSFPRNLTRRSPAATTSRSSWPCCTMALPSPGAAARSSPSQYMRGPWPERRGSASRAQRADNGKALRRPISRSAREGGSA